MTETTPEATPDFDPFLTAIIANRIDGIVREMTYTMLRSARSAVINSARDFSCSICTADNELLAAAEGLPIHIFGSHMQTSTMTRLHGADMREGDCYLHNDPYTGNSHPADHTFLVPVYVEGEHLFTAVAKAHQADIGNSLPTTYMPMAKDVYSEGSLIFPAVRIQRDYEMNEDIIAMCRSRIRVPSQWYGDFLAGIGSARVAERRLRELCAKYGKERIKTFVRDWLDYSENRMVAAISKLPAMTVRRSTLHDPFPEFLPDGVPINVTVGVDPVGGWIDLDLRDNIDNVDCGVNESEACATAATFAGVFNSIDPEVPRNSGSFRRVRLRLRDGCVVGRPEFPHSCSTATTNVAERLVNLVGGAFAELGDGHGIAEGGVGAGAVQAVISGKDDRGGEGAYINQLIIAGGTGPGSPKADGWPTYGSPVVGGLMYRDSLEIDELKHPMLFSHLRLLTGTGGAGRNRGAPAIDTGYGPRDLPMDVVWNSDGTINPSKGVRGGREGCTARHWRVDADGTETELSNLVILRLAKGERVRGWTTSGGGYGDPRERAPDRVLRDVLEGYETIERAREIYGVAFTGGVEEDTLAVDVAATGALRAAPVADAR
ncbi:MAG: hydantoinase [Rhodovulum sulfidophilum]|uniref:Hydantoinase n=1 Tax=Rhodovulum sulfidophilum TaxID=35806 RepID=A0A2W5NEF6_RHOSU|nr:MAG: hydantoinase [Rhodovulum sulfidophilum]